MKIKQVGQKIWAEVKVGYKKLTVAIYKVWLLDTLEDIAKTHTSVTDKVNEIISILKENNEV